MISQFEINNLIQENKLQNIKIAHKLFAYKFTHDNFQKALSKTKIAKYIYEHSKETQKTRFRELLLQDQQYFPLYISLVKRINKNMIFKAILFDNYSLFDSLYSKHEPEEIIIFCIKNKKYNFLKNICYLEGEWLVWFISISISLLTSLLLSEIIKKIIST